MDEGPAFVERKRETPMDPQRVTQDASTFVDVLVPIPLGLEVANATPFEA